MAIERCSKCDLPFDRDWNTECPRCPAETMAAMMQRVEITERGTNDLNRRLMDGYPFQAKDKALHDECKRVLGEA